MPGRRRVDWELGGLAMGGGGFGRTVDWLTTALSWLGLPPKLRLSGCHVLRLQASSATLDVESRRDHPDAVEAVGDDTRLLLDGEKAPTCEVFSGAAPNRCLAGGGPVVEWKGLAPEGTLRRRPGVRVPALYAL